MLPEDMAEMALVEEAEFLGEVNDRLRGCDETLTGISQSQLSDVSGEGVAELATEMACELDRRKIGGTSDLGE